jgi:hypothetical protein
MNKKLNILNEAGYELTVDEFEQLQSKHPYIGEKLILDLVNGVGVVAKDLNEASKSKEKGHSRIWDGLSGNGKKRQNLVNENIIEGLKATSLWLQDHSRHLSRIDLRMRDIADELYKTQDEVIKKFGNVDIRIEQLESFQQNSIERFNKLEDRITKEEAYTHIDKEVEKIGNLKLPLALEIFTVMDNLSSGKAGLYHALETDNIEKNEFQDHITHKIKNRLSPSEKKSFIDHVSLHEEIKRLEPIEQKAIAFIGSQYSSYGEDNSLYEVSDIIKIISTSTSSSEMETQQPPSTRRRVSLTF